MGHSAFLSDAGNRLNGLLGVRVLARGGRLAAQFATEDEADGFLRLLPEEKRADCFPLVAPPPETTEQAEQLVASAARQMGGLDLLLHGNEWADEAELREHDVWAVHEAAERRLLQLFLYGRAAGQLMARKKKGMMIVPLAADSLYSAGYPGSPIYNGGALAIVKSLAKELSPFRISVNALTLGYYRPENDPDDWADRRRKLDIYALKARVPEWSDGVRALDMLLDYGDGMSGQNVCWGYGTVSII